MKKITTIVSSIFVLASVLVSCGTDNADMKPVMNVMTFNVRLDTPSDSLNNWKYRKDNVCDMINYYQPSLFGCQEVCNNQMEDMKVRLMDYQAIGVGRDDGKTMGEYCPIFFRKDQFELLDSGNFSLSETPYQFGIRGWDASYNRVATWALLKMKSNGMKLLYYNTHLDNDGKIARQKSAELVLEHIKECNPGIPVIVTGDFNCGPDAEPLIVFRNAGFSCSYQDALVKYGPEYTFHDFGRLAEKDCEQIDYVLVSDHRRILRSRTIQDNVRGWNFSDHYPVMSQIEL